MRFLVKVSFPVEAGNAAAKKDGFKVIQTILSNKSPRQRISLPKPAGAPAF
jgi:hypothetical protein